MLKFIRVIHEANGPRLYQQINKLLGINSKSLTDRLQELEKYGIINRVQYSEIPPRVEYSATDVAEDLQPIFDALVAFEMKHIQEKSYLINSEKWFFSGIIVDILFV